MWRLEGTSQRDRGPGRVLPMTLRIGLESISSRRTKYLRREREYLQSTRKYLQPNKHVDARTIMSIVAKNNQSGGQSSPLASACAATTSRGPSAGGAVMAWLLRR